VSTTGPIPDPEVESFLALLASNRAPRTVDAYRRDLAALAAWSGKPLARITTERLEQYIAELEQRIGWLEQRFWPRVLRAGSRLVQRVRT